jgi:hypothetical protein
MDCPGVPEGVFWGVLLIAIIVLPALGAIGGRLVWSEEFSKKADTGEFELDGKVFREVGRAPRRRRGDRG